jgi:SsrA-binding protein
MKNKDTKQSLTKRSESPAKEKKEKIITINKKAYHDYEILNKYEAGIALLGTELKTLRQQKGSVSEAYCRIKEREIWLINSNIPEYRYGTTANHSPLRDRKLLLHKNEIKKIISKLQEKGYALIPLKLYFSGSKVKAEIAFAKGKRQYDKREAIKKEEMKRQLKRVKQSY